MRENQYIGKPSIVVVGAGISGIHAALELAEMGCHVCLIDKAPWIGGLLSRIDHQFPDDHCGMCRMLPMINRDECAHVCLRTGVSHDRISIMTLTEIESVSGNPGKLTVRMIRRPTGVDPLRCTGCGVCERICPVEIPDIFNAGLGRRKAIYLPDHHQPSLTRVIDWQSCTRCNACADACPEQAITFFSEPETIELENIAGVIYAPGAPLFDPGVLDVYGYGQLPNVMTSLGFERLLSSSGPFAGNPVRPSDQKPIEKIAWIQCVGSRNIMIGADHCSSACCMFAVKEAILARQKITALTETSIFYMDMRTFGRDFQRYRDRAENELGVKFIRCRIHSIEPAEEPGDLKITYMDTTGHAVEAVFDLVVLSTGRQPLMDLPSFTTHEGVTVLETVPGLTDIAESVISAGVSAGRTFQRLHQAERHPVDFISRSIQSPKTGFEKKPRCHLLFWGVPASCNARIDWEYLSGQLHRIQKDFPVTRIQAFTGMDDLPSVMDAVIKSASNRLIIVSSYPHHIRSHMNRIAVDIGLASSLIQVLDLNPFMAKDGSEFFLGDFVREIEMVVSRLRSRSASIETERKMDKTVLVIGGGPAGLGAALSLARLQVNVMIVEKQDRLGGNLPRIFLPETRQTILELMDKVEQNPLIEVYLNAQVESSEGLPGGYVSRIRLNSGEEKIISHGATILAIGGKSAETDAYGLGTHESIISQFDLEERIDTSSLGERPLNTIVMIQCAGSREEPSNYCSRICCVKAIRNAIKLKELNPDITIWVFYRDIMTYGEFEKLYTEARRKGIIFIPFDADQKPSVTMESGRPIVTGRDPFMAEDVRLAADLVVLSTGVVPQPVDDICKIFKLEKTRDGFIQEADSKWRPVDTGREGIFVAGLIRAPANAEEAMRQGEAAAYRAFGRVNRNLITAPRATAKIRHALCSGCELCIDTCPYGARYIDMQQGKIIVDILSCQGCGACAAVCPNSATVMGDFEDGGILDVIEAAL